MLMSAQMVQVAVPISAPTLLGPSRAPAETDTPCRMIREHVKVPKSEEMPFFHNNNYVY